MKVAPIGIFDSGFGGLSIYREIKKLLPQYSYIYLGDTAQAPYGCLSFEEIYQNTLKAVQFLFDQGCHLVILACNTASAQALRTLQQTFLLEKYPQRRVLGVIRPCSEQVMNWSQTGHIGLLATDATVCSNSYGIEIAKFAPEIELSQLACHRWVHLVEMVTCTAIGH
jgi:glutamate racemase